MSFTVIASTSSRKFSYHRISMLDALAQALSFQASGMPNVQIVDGDGRVQTPSAIYQLMFGAPDAVAPAK